ncbi:reverse transcriptase domain-containing protein [Tanacetum coccineum]
MTIRFDSLASNPPSARFTSESITLLSIWQFQVYFGKTKERLCTLRPPSELLSMTLPDSRNPPISDEALQEYCDKNYHQILPIIAEKVLQEKVQQEKLKAVKARLNFEEASRHSESGAPSRRRSLKERIGPRHARSVSKCPKSRHGRSKSPRKKDPKRSTVFKRLEKSVFHRLGDKKKNVSAHLRDLGHRESSQRTEALSESEGSSGGYWKSKPKKQKSSVEDDLSQPWVCEETDHFTPRIRYFDFPRTRMPSHIKTYDGSEDPEDHLKIFQADAKMERWAMPTWCHMFNSTLTRNAKRIARQRITQIFSPESVISFPPLGEVDGTEGPMIIEAEIGGHCVHRMKTKGKEDPGNPIHDTQNAKFAMVGGIVTLRSGKIIPLECSMVSEPGVSRHVINRVAKEKNQVAIHLEYLEQTVVIGSTLTEEGQKELCGLLRRHLDMFAWKPADMTGVSRHVAEHRLNIREGCLPVRQKKRGQASKRNKIICEEVEKLVDADIMKEVHYHSWLSNPIMVEKHDGNAYKGYHQIKMAEEDEEKTAFITSQGIFCYSKMPFRLKNTGATYQRLVDKAFQKQIGRNLEVYVDDLVIKSRTKKEVIRDMEERFKTLREINMKLNPKKCAFGMREGTFLGYKVDADGLRSFPFFKTMKKCTKKSDFQWTAEAEMAFKRMKQLIAELPMLVTRKEKEELIMYLAAVKEAISAVLMTKKDEKLLKWRFKLKEHDIQYKPRTSVKGQILADFIVERPEDATFDTPIEEGEELLDPWVLFTDGSSCIDGSEAGLIITNPEGMEFTYALRFRFNATNNEAEYESLIAGLWIAGQMGV